MHIEKQSLNNAHLNLFGICRLDYLFLDSSFLCYKILFSLVEKISREKIKSLDFNLFLSLDLGHPLWQWL